MQYINKIDFQKMIMTIKIQNQKLEILNILNISLFKLINVGQIELLKINFNLSDIIQDLILIQKNQKIQNLLVILLSIKI